MLGTWSVDLLKRKFAGVFRRVNCQLVVFLERRATFFTLVGLWSGVGFFMFPEALCGVIHPLAIWIRTPFGIRQR